MLKSSLLLMSSLMTMQAMAGTQTWDLDDSPLYGGSNNGNYLSLTEDSITLKITGWSDTEGNNDDIIASGELAFYGSGELGLINRDEGDQQPDHSIDSNNSNPSRNSDDYDAVLLEFSQAVNLEEFYVGWAYDGSYGAADISLLAYTNHSGNGTSDIEGSSWNNIIGQGWESVNNYANVDDYSYQIVDTTVTSKYWLIGAYNPVFGVNGQGYANDGFKLKEISTNSSSPRTEVPEPNALAILVVGLLSLVRVRRRDQQI